MRIEQTASKTLMCPTCKVDLVMSERQSIEIDYCPKCRGVWLDRGELDKIIERSVSQGDVPSGQNADVRGSQHYNKPYYGGHHGGGYRRKSWLHELFD